MKHDRVIALMNSQELCLGTKDLPELKPPEIPAEGADSCCGREKSQFSSEMQPIKGYKYSSR